MGVILLKQDKEKGDVSDEKAVQTRVTGLWILKSLALY
jgi:hypothetical protein